MRGRAPSPAGLAIALAVALGAPAASAEKPAGLAPTPPMGWNSWNRFGCEGGEELIRRTADAMVASGMREAGYRNR